MKDFVLTCLKTAKAVVITYDTQRRNLYIEAINFWYNSVIEIVQEQ